MIAGVDEAGRGPLAGPVMAAAVILDPDHPIEGLRDSKKLSAKKRETLAEQIQEYALAYSVCRADVEEIDRLNILRASLLAMERALTSLSVHPHKVLVDGTHAPNTIWPVETIIKGDDKIPEIAAASILAKVMRDREMLRLDQVYPEYGFARHKGYPTKLHIEALQQHGVLPIHRKSFRPVAEKL